MIASTLFRSPLVISGRASGRVSARGPAALPTIRCRSCMPRSSHLSGTRRRLVAAVAAEGSAAPTERVAQLTDELRVLETERDEAVKTGEGYSQSMRRPRGHHVHRGHRRDALAALPRAHAWRLPPRLHACMAAPAPPCPRRARMATSARVQTRCTPHAPRPPCSRVVRAHVCAAGGDDPTAGEACSGEDQGGLA
jgi:hypothetical protein